MASFATDAFARVESFFATGLFCANVDSGKSYEDWCAEQKPTLDRSILNISLFLLSFSAGDTVLSRLGE